MNNKTAEKQERGYTAAVIIFIIGIIAVVAAMVIGLSNINFRLLICEGIALLCLIGLLVVSVRAKRSVARQREEHRRNPYASVNKKEIDKVLDMIVEEEKKRKRLDAFAAGVDIRSAQNEKSHEQEEPEAAEPEPDPDEDLRIKLAQAAMDEDKDAEDVMPIVFDDDDEDKKAKDAPNEEKEITEEEPENKGEEETEVNGNYRDDYDERPARRRPPEDRDRRERDPYYDDYYGERPRSRERDPRDRERDPYASRGYYNEYGEPVRRRRPPAAYDPYYDDYYGERPRSRERDPRDPRERSRDPYASRGYYNEYGEPVRRRPPQDERDRYQQRRRRPSDDYYEGRPEGRPRPEDDRRRPDTAGAEKAVIDEEEKTAAAAPTPVPEEPAPKKEYDEDYVPVVIPDDERDEHDVVHTGRAGVGSLGRENRSVHKEDHDHDHQRHHTPHRSQPQSRYYDDDEEMESMPIAFADDDEYERRYQNEDTYSQRSSQRANDHQSSRKEDKYIPDYEEESVVSLPRDDGFDEYMEEKLAEERKAERLAKRKESGKIVLTIAKIRRRKIRRKSRKYKTFRASVHHLADYLNSFNGKN